MIIFRLVKGVIKLFLTFIIGIIVIGLLIVGLVRMNRSEPDYSGYNPTQTVPEMVDMYNRTASLPDGTYCKCPVCGNHYYKYNIVCCSYDCEDDYHEILQAYRLSMEGNRIVRQHGKTY